MTEVVYNKTKNDERWHIKGTSICHRDDAPAYIHYDDNGIKYYEKWYQHGELHREAGPAVIGYHDNGNKEYELWYQNNKLHREDGPYEVWYYKNGNKRYEGWRKNGKKHRLDGPTRIEYYYSGYVKEYIYYINDKKINNIWIIENIIDPLNPTPEEKALLLLTFG